MPGCRVSAPGKRFMANKPTYSEQLKDVRWQQMALRLKDAANWRCEHCGRREADQRGKMFSLHVHHLFYIKDRAPWEYPSAYLVVLCSECHAGTHDAWDKLKATMATALRKTHHSQLFKAGVRMFNRAMEEVR